MKRKKVIAISGSTRAQSTNTNYIKAIAALYADVMEISIYDGLQGLPHFNPDDDTEPAPAAVAAFRKLLREADGVIICTPEYAMGVPGTLKNAIDWTVSSCEFSHKPTLLITASSMGEKAHASLLGTLRIIEADISDEMQVHIPFARTKIRDEIITDEGTLKQLKAAVEALLGRGSSE